MKSILFLIVRKQWKAYIILMLSFLVACLLLYGVQQKMNAVFKMPIAVQDLDHSKASQNLVHALENTQYITIKKLDESDAFIEDSIKANVAVLSLSIPEGFEQKLKDKSLRDAITVYYRDDFVGTIAQEITSKTLYQQQIPYIVTSHINQHKHVLLKDVQHQYHKETPTSRIKQFAMREHQDTSISLSAVYAMLLFVAAIQVILHQRLKQNAALSRLFMFNHSQVKLHTVYVLIHTLLMLSTLFIIAQWMNQQMSFRFYFVCFGLTVIYETVLSILLFKINTTSHRLFMTVTFTIALIVLYMSSVTGGLL
ncbi:ABC transporter permease [Macrococcoides caseolyticum]|uniref:ABC transporter permease n=1 Tax=Macrococcoides caseolyticum TaxID=69966 RepID=UPI001F1AB607|nr:ABC transporter permease [Macrococcus caseolyticus]MCE4956537.1 ABC transporter permease [Macrococcus caseolyticus]